MNQELSQLPFPNRQIFEEIIIGSILQDTTVIHIANAILEPDDFELQPARIVYECCLQLYVDKIGIDLITVLNQLKKNGTEQTVGGAKYLVEVTDRISSTAHFEYHCRLMKEWTVRKQVQRLALQTTDILMDETIAVQSILDEMIKTALIIIGKLQDTSMKSSYDVIKSMWHDIESGKGLGQPMTDIAALNNVVEGISGGDLIVIAGRPGSGKSILVSNIISAAIIEGNSALAWSLEMTNEVVLQRLISKISNVSYKKISANDLTDAQRMQITRAEDTIVTSKCLFVDATGVSATQIRSHLIQLATNEPIDTIVIDHGGLLRHINPDNQNSVEEIGNTTKQLKLTAKELNIKIILLWQLNRQAAKGDIPTLGDLRGSGRIEEDADKVIFVHRPELFPNAEDTITVNGNEYPIEGTVQFIVAKNRRGPTGSAVAYFDKETFSFKDRASISMSGHNNDDIPW